MEFGLKISFLLLLLTGTVTVRGSDLSDVSNHHDSHHAPAVNRPKRWSGISVFDSLRGKGASFSQPKPTKPTGGDGPGFNLADALSPKPSKAAGGDGAGFNLEDALRPAVKPTEKPTGGDCPANLVQKLATVIENQQQQLRLLLQLMARSPSSRFSHRAMR